MMHSFLNYSLNETIYLVLSVINKKKLKFFLYYFSDFTYRSGVSSDAGLNKHEES